MGDGTAWHRYYAHTRRLHGYFTRTIGVPPADSHTPVSRRGVRLVGRLFRARWSGAFGQWAVGGRGFVPANVRGPTDPTDVALLSDSLGLNTDPFGGYATRLSPTVASKDRQPNRYGSTFISRNARDSCPTKAGILLEYEIKFLFSTIEGLRMGLKNISAATNLSSSVISKIRGLCCSVTVNERVFTK
jgi:hypothetical protein